jgi:hypothetical protein
MHGSPQTGAPSSPTTTNRPTSTTALGDNGLATGSAAAEVVNVAEKQSVRSAPKAN